MDIKDTVAVSGASAREDARISEIKRQAKGSESITDPHARARAEKAAQDFESMLLKQMIGSMQQTVSKEGLLKSKDEETYRDMLNEALSDSIAKGQGIGIKDIIMKELVKRGGRV